MRRWSFIFAALFIAGCSSHSVVQSQSFTPDIFQRKLYHGWQPIRLAAINGNTPQVTGIASDAVNHKMWAITNAQPATGGSLTRITMGGQLDTYPMALTPWAITVGPDDNVWVADEDTNSNLFVSRFTQSGVETDYPIPQFMEASVVVEQIINGPDGAMWFTACYPQGNVGGVGRIDTSGSVSFFPSFCDMAIASGPDGNLWYGDRTNVYAMNTQGTILGTYPIGQVQPKGIAAGADGNLYVLSVDSQQMSWCSRVTPGGIITPVGSAVSHPITSTDGKLWMFTTGGHMLAYDPVAQTWGQRVRGQLQRYYSDLSGGPDGNLWNAPGFDSVMVYAVQVMTATPKSLTVAVGHQAQVTVSESNYVGQWTALAHDKSIIQVDPVSKSGVFNVTGLAVGSTYFGISDSMYNSVKVRVTVTP